MSGTRAKERRSTKTKAEAEPKPALQPIPVQKTTVETDCTGLLEIRMAGRDPFDVDMVQTHLRLEAIEEKHRNDKGGKYLDEIAALVAELSSGEPCTSTQAYWFFAEIRKQFVVFQKKTFGPWLAELTLPPGSQASTLAG